MPDEIPLPLFVKKLHEDPNIEFRLAKSGKYYFGGISINVTGKNDIELDIDWDEFGKEYKQTEEEIDNLIEDEFGSKPDFNEKLKEAEKEIGIGSD